MILSFNKIFRILIARKKGGTLLMHEVTNQQQKYREKKLQQRSDFSKTWIGRRKLHMQNIKEKQLYMKYFKLRN